LVPALTDVSATASTSVDGSSAASPSTVDKSLAPGPAASEISFAPDHMSSRSSNVPSPVQHQNQAMDVDGASSLGKGAPMEMNTGNGMSSIKYSSFSY